MSKEQEQVDFTKIASECQEAAETGFVTQLKLQGMDDEKIKTALASYREVMVKRAKRYEDVVAAIKG
jgi:hypothetical protein